MLWHILGVFIARGKEDVLVTLNQVVGESVYGEKRMSVEVKKIYMGSLEYEVKCVCNYQILRTPSHHMQIQDSQIF